MLDIQVMVELSVPEDVNSIAIAEVAVLRVSVVVVLQSAGAE